MTNEEIQNIFFLECEEALAGAEEGLMACQSGEADSETVNGIFRAVHSIKGGVGAFSFTVLQAFTHKFETVLSYVRDGELGLSDSLTTLMLRAFDVLADHVAAARGEGEVPDDAAISQQLEEIAERAAAGQPAFDEDSAPAAPPVDEAPAETVEETVAADEAPVEQAEELAELASPVDDMGLDFDLDDLMGDLAVSEEEAAAFEAAAAEVERAADAKVVAKEQARQEAAAEADENRGEAYGRNLHIRFRDGALANGSEPLLMLRELEEMGGLCIAVDAGDVPTLDKLDVEKAYLAWTFYIPPHADKKEVEEIFDFIGDECELKFESLSAPVQREGIVVKLAEVLPQQQPEKAMHRKKRQ